MIRGIIEGFYGLPWSHESRLIFLDFLNEHGGNTYVWAAKSEPRHRDKWDEPFTTEELAQFAELAARQSGIKIFIGLTPGSQASPNDVIEKLSPAFERGCHGVVLSFDDLPVLNAAQRHRELANAVVDVLKVPVWLVPTHYSGTTSSPYLENLFEGLHRDVLVMWTGRQVVNDSITATEAAARARACDGRKPLLWDNTPVNDAMMSESLHMGPYTSRQADLVGEIAGLLLNPMEFCRASMPTVASALAWARGDDPIQVWNRCVDRRGWREIAESTAFPDDLHWPGAHPSTQWWRSVADMQPIDIDEGCAPWIEAARQGAQLVVAAREILANSPDQQLAAMGKIRLAVKWREWRRLPVLTFGSGPRLRPLLTNDETGKFVYGTGSVAHSTSLVDDEIARFLRTE